MGQTPSTKTLYLDDVLRDKEFKVRRKPWVKRQHFYEGENRDFRYVLNTDAKNIEIVFGQAVDIIFYAQGSDIPGTPTHEELFDRCVHEEVRGTLWNSWKPYRYCIRKYPRPQPVPLLDTERLRMPREYKREVEFNPDRQMWKWQWDAIGGRMRHTYSSY